MKKTLIILSGVLLAQPIQAAGILSQSSDLKSVIKNIMDIFQSLVPLLIGAAVVVFLWGVVVFIAKSSKGDVDGRKEGTNFMIFGIIGITVMVSVWGLVAFVAKSLGSDTYVPQFKTGSTAPNLTMPNSPDYVAPTPASPSSDAPLTFPS